MSAPIPSSRIQHILNSLDGVKAAGDGWIACCPAHDDSTPSLTIDEQASGTITVRCHAGCQFEEIVHSAGLDPADFFPPSTTKKRGRGGESMRLFTVAEMRDWASTTALYEYHDDKGEVAYVVRRHMDEEGRKSFKQYRAAGAAGDGKFVSGMEGVRRWLFGVPRILEAVKKSETIWVVEGEKDATRLQFHGLCATCNVGGAAKIGGKVKWPRDARDYLRDVPVVIIPDNDEPGREHAQKVAQSLHGAATSIRILELPGVKEKGDVSDWLDDGGTVGELLRLAQSAPRWDAPLEAPDKEFCTDMGNANRFVKQHGDDVRFCKAWKDWLVWTGGRWSRDETSEIVRRAKATALSIMDEAKDADLNQRDRDDLDDFALKSQSRDRLFAMITLAQSELPIRTEELDLDPMILNVQNGAVDLRTGELRDHRREDLCTKLAPVDFDADAKCPMWDAFLDRVLGSKPDLISYLQRVAGYLLTGFTTEECLFLLHGQGRNGKGTFVETMVALLGDYAVAFPTEMLLEQKNQQSGPTPHVARLKGARFAHASETGEGRRMAEAFVKHATGNDTLTARFCHGNPFDFRPTHKIFLAANHKPVVKGTDEGIWSRIHLVPFTVYIPPEHRDQHLKQKLREQELSGILAWAVRGCLEWQRMGLCPPSDVMDATAQYRDESDVIGQFFEDCCDRGEDYFAPSSALYSAFVNWARTNGRSEMSAVAFGRTMPDRGLRPGKQTVSGMQCRGWLGARLKASLRAGDDGRPESEQPNLFDRLPPKPGAASIETQTYVV